MSEAADEDLALRLHKELNAIPLRVRRGADAQASLDRLKKAARGERGAGSSEGGGGGRKRRESDDGHTSQQRVTREPSGSTTDTEPGQQGRQGRGSKAKQRKRLGSSDGSEEGALVLAASLPPAEGAALEAADAVLQALKKQHARRPGSSSSQGRVKVFFAGQRWGLDLAASSVRSRESLARALNDAYEGHILSVGQGECLRALFVDAAGSVGELGPTKHVGSAASKADAERWGSLAKAAARVYVGSGHEAAAAAAAAGAERASQAIEPVD